MTTTTTTTTRRKILFTMGLPGAGKSTVADRLFPGAAKIDPDLVKQSHPDYDPKDPAPLHPWSKDVTDRMWSDCLAGLTSDEITLLDGTGTNSEDMIRKIRDAKNAGFEAVLLYVRVPLTVALERNAARERNVPESIVIQKSTEITISFDIVRNHADSVTVVDNA
jgi:predicted kinase